MSLPPELIRSLERRVREQQRSWRTPGLVAAIVRDGRPVWSLGVGTTDVGLDGTTDVGSAGSVPTTSTAFAIGSITKTFTAALIMGLRDDGALALSDRVDHHLPGIAHGDLTLRELLAHASGLQREPAGDIWVELDIPPIEQMVADLAAVEQVLPARMRFHYSNLAFAVLGEVAARRCGQPWADAVRVRLLEPLGMTGTGLSVEGPRAVGYFVEPFSDRVTPERWPDMGGFAAAGGLWSTIDDLARWSALLAGERPDVLAEASVEQMTRPEIMVDLEKWSAAYGLGLQLLRVGDRVFAGHSGGMPGFISGLMVRRPERTGAIVLTNASANAAATDLAVELLGMVVDADPVGIEPWVAFGDPDGLAELTGPWWSEGGGFTFAVRAGRLEARVDGQPTDKPPAVFERLSADLFRTVSGREEGELLRVSRDRSGRVEQLLWATYPFTREPRPFGPRREPQG